MLYKSWSYAGTLFALLSLVVVIAGRNEDDIWKVFAFTAVMWFMAILCHGVAALHRIADKEANFKGNITLLK